MIEDGKLFDGCGIHIIPKCIGPKRCQLFKSQITKYGGRVFAKGDCDSSLSYVVYDESLSADDPEIKYFLTIDWPVKIVGTKWLSECIKNKTLVPIDKFQLIVSHNEPNTNLKEIKSKVCEVESPPKKSKIEESVKELPEMSSLQVFNSELIAELNKLAKMYRSLGDVYRARNYASVVSIIQKHPKQIESYEEALTISGITERMATKIGEIVETGSLRRTDELMSNEKVKVVELFTQIWGVGPATAENWFSQGHRTLEDVKNKCNLNKMQKIGIKYFDDFQKPIPRHEVEEVYKKVTEAAKSVDSNIRTEICGSYRRGKQLCGDIDIVVFEHNEDHSQLMEKLLKILTNSKFVRDDFASLEAAKHHKFLGICKLPNPDSVFRRLDIFIVPFKEYAAAMIHYTGSANFNIGLRQYAMKKGMHLSENGLFDKVIRQGSIVVTGNSLLTPTEESIFQLLGVPYRKPEERESLIMKDLGD